jgi:gliding motility-associated-like protein
VAFVNLSTPFGDECVWNLGDGTIHDGCTDFIHTYNGGIYDVSLTVTANGCTNSFTIPDYIHAVPLPVANFVPFPSTINLTSTNVQMNNYSDNATSYTWNFGDGSDTSSLFEPSHVFPEAINGVYEVMLVAENEFGCTDTTYATVFYEDLMIFYVPNSFTPNSDGMNDSFKPIFTSRINETDFKFTIYNRWGEVVFETFDLNAAWDGTYNGVIVKDAVFIWTVSFRDTITDKKYDHKGHITVFR